MIKDLFCLFICLLWIKMLSLKCPLFSVHDFAHIFSTFVLFIDLCVCNQYSIHYIEKILYLVAFCCNLASCVLIFFFLLGIKFT